MEREPYLGFRILFSGTASASHRRTALDGTMKQTKIFYGWVVVAVSFISLAITYAVWNSFSIFFVAMIDEFGWSRGSTALAFSIFTSVYAIGAPITGAAVDRFGPRKVMPIGALFLAGGMFASSFVTEIWHLYLFYGIFAAFGVNAVGTMVSFTVLSNWFSRRRGTAIGIAASGIGLGTFVLVPLSQYVINIAGWRMAYIVLGAVVLVTIPALTLLFQRHRPEDMGLLPDGGPAAVSKLAGGRAPAQMRIVNAAWANCAWTARSAACTRRFWFLFLGLAFGTISHQSVMIHQVAYLTGKQFDPMLGATVVGLVGLFGSVGKISWGWVSDRIGREGAYSLGMVCVILGVLVLSLIGDPSQIAYVYVYAMLFGVGYGVFSPLASSTAADLFQGRSFGSIYGLLWLGSGIGSSIGPWASGALFDATGTYAASYVMSFVAAFLSIAAFWLAGPRQVRQVPGVAARRQTTDEGAAAGQ
jgi:MFS family permease